MSHLIAAQQILETAVNTASNEVKTTRVRLLDELGLTLPDSNLTPEQVKKHPDYIAAKASYNQAFQALREFNKLNAAALRKARKNK